MLMSEPDHIWLRPMPNLMKGRRPAAFPFFYIGEPFSRRICSIQSPANCITMASTYATKTWQMTFRQKISSLWVVRHS